MKNVKRAAALALCGLLVLGSLFGCSASATDGLQIIRIGHNQSTNHPTHTRFSPASFWALRTRWCS